MELQAWSVAARLVAFLCHRLQGWPVGTTAPVRRGRSALVRKGGFPPGQGPAYPRITEGDPVLHPVPEGLEAQIGVITEVADHAHILPAAVLDLEQLRTGCREKQLPHGSVSSKDLGVDRPGVWEK